MIVDKINSYLSGKPFMVPSLLDEAAKIASHTFERQFMKEGSRGKYIGLSQCGKCARQVAYQYHGYEPKGKESDSRSKVVFYMGDLTEAMVYLLAKLSGCEITEGGLEQKTLSLTINEKQIFGHPDGFLQFEGERYLVEIKSMTSFSFNDFQRGVIDEAYEAQINAYLESEGIDKCVMVAFQKEAGLLDERIITKNFGIVKSLKENLGDIISSSKELLPKRKHSPNKDGFLPWNCLYCSYWGRCYPNAYKVLIKNKYKLKVGKEGIKIA